MNNGVNGNYTMMPTADLGGQKLLGVGSLTNYINTGNPSAVDNFTRSSSCPTCKQPFNLMNAIKIGTVGAAALAGVALFVKKGDTQKIKQFFDGIWENISSKFKKVDLSKPTAEVKKAAKTIKNQAEKEAKKVFASPKKACSKKNNFTFWKKNSTPIKFTQAQSGKFDINFKSLFKSKNQVKSEYKNIKNAPKKLFGNFKASISAFWQSFKSKFKRKKPTVIDVEATPVGTKAKPNNQPPKVIYLGPPSNDNSPKIAGLLPEGRGASQAMPQFEVDEEMLRRSLGQNQPDIISQKLYAQKMQDLQQQTVYLLPEKAGESVGEIVKDEVIDEVIDETLPEIVQDATSSRVSSKVSAKKWSSRSAFNSAGVASGENVESIFFNGKFRGFRIKH